jgi:putative transposase
VRQHLLATLHSPEFVNPPPPDVYATLLDRGISPGLIRTCYRVFADSVVNEERKNKRKPHAYAKPERVATAPKPVQTSVQPGQEVAIAS